MKNLKKFVALGLSLTVSLGILSGCSDSGEVTSSNSGSNIIKTSDKEYDDYVVRVVNSGGLCTAPIQIAYEKGFFEEAGVKVEMIRGGGSTSQEMLTGNLADVAQDMLPNTVMRIDNGLDVKIALGIHTGCLSILVSPDSDIKEVADLKGKTIGVPGLGSSQMAIAQRALANAKVGTSASNMEVEFVAFSGSELAMVLENGTVDAIVTSDPLGENIVRDGIGKIIFSNTTHPDYVNEFCCALNMRPQFVEDHPVAAERVTRAIQRATKFVGENSVETATIQVEKDYIPKDDPKYYANIIGMYKWDGSVEGGKIGLRNNLNDLKDLGLIKGDMDIDRVVNSVYIEFESLKDN